MPDKKVGDINGVGSFRCLNKVMSCFGWWFAKLSQYILLGIMWSLLRMNDLVTSILDHNWRNLHCLRHNGLYSSKIKHACKCMVMVDSTDLSHGRRTASTACSHVHESALSLAKVVASIERSSSSSNSTFIYIFRAVDLLMRAKQMTCRNCSSWKWILRRL